MKKTSLFICFAIFLCPLVLGCSSSIDKAERAIREYMKMNLADYDSYEVVETKVDTAFTPFFNEEVINSTLSYRAALRSLNEQLSKIHKAEDNVVYWANSMSLRSFSEYDKARFELRKEEDTFFEIMAYYCNNAKNVLSLSDSLGHKQVGWAVEHTFRAQNKEGNKDILDMIFVLDEKYNKVLFEFTNDEIRVASESFSYIQKNYTIEKLDAIMKKCDSRDYKGALKSL